MKRFKPLTVQPYNQADGLDFFYISGSFQVDGIIYRRTQATNAVRAMFSFLSSPNSGERTLGGEDWGGSFSYRRDRQMCETCWFNESWYIGSTCDIPGHKQMEHSVFVS